MLKSNLSEPEQCEIAQIEANKKKKRKRKMCIVIAILPWHYGGATQYMSYRV